MGPINYLPPQQDFLQSLQGGLQLGANVAAVTAKREAEERAAQQAAQYQADVQAAAANPTPQAFAQLTLKYPQHREAFQAGWKNLDEQQQRSALAEMSDIGAALEGGRADVAQKLIEAKIGLMGKAGEPTTTQEFLLDQIKTDPQAAKATVMYITSRLPGGDKVLEGLGKIGTEQRAQAKAPAELAKAEADAKSAGAKAKYAESDALLDLEKKGWDVKKIKADIDIAKENARIAAMNASFAKEGNALKKQELELKIQEARGALDEKVRARAAEAETGVAAIDNMLNTIQRVKSNKSLNDVVGSIEGRLPAVMSDEGADAISMIETLTSQAFMAQIPNMKGTGALSEKEGDKLQSSLQNLSRVQSESQFRANLDEASRLMNKARENISKRSGVPLKAPDTPAAPGARPPLASFQK